MRSLVVILFLSSLLLASEPSVFGAGDLNNPNPYGLTHEEKLIHQNKKEIEGIAQKNNLQSARVESVTEQLDGIKGIVEGLSQSVNEHRIALQKIDESTMDRNKSISVNDLLQQNNSNSENIAKFKVLLEELSRTVDGINATYVTKEEFSALIKQLKVSLPASTAVPKKMDNSSIEKEAKKLFEQKKYSESQAYFEMMIQKKYKSAEANFWIGETYFEQKKYKEAISYYKLSASENEKSSVMPTLLLHTGIAMEKNGDIANAKAFYSAAVSRFPGSGVAEEATKKLSKLK